jgi:hypothetical protein
LEAALEGCRLSRRACATTLTPGPSCQRLCSKEEVATAIKHTGFENAINMLFREFSLDTQLVLNMPERPALGYNFF